MQFGGRVGFLIIFPFHEAMLRPVFERLQPHTECLMSTDVDAIVKFKPDILLLAEHHNAFLRHRLPETLLLSPTHGLGASKNYAAESMAWYDIVCLPSDWYRDYFTERGWLPRLDFWVTGFTAMDGALSGTDSSSGCIPEFMAGTRGGKTLLFAPTYTVDLTALEVLGETWLDELLARFESLDAVVKLHPHTAERFPEWVALYKRLAAANPRISLIENSDSNVYDLLPYTDILLTDVSSVALNFLYYDRPIILVNHPQRQRSPRYEPEGLIWQWRDMGEQVGTPDDLSDAVGRALQDPTARSETRQLYRQRRFGSFADGRAAQRIATAVLELIAPGLESADRVRIMRTALHSLGNAERQVNELKDELHAREPGNYDVNINYSYVP